MAKTCINYLSNIVQNFHILTDKISHEIKKFWFNFVDPLGATISKYANHPSTLLLSEVIYQNKIIIIPQF